MTKNFINVTISAKDDENPQLLIILNKVNDNSIFLNIINVNENTLEVAKYIENQHLLNIINAFLAEDKKGEYNLRGSDYREFYLNFINLIFYQILLNYFSAFNLYNEIKLISLNEY